MYRVPIPHHDPPATPSPHRDVARTRAAEWATNLGFFDTGPDGIQVWDREAYETMDFPGAMARCHPKATCDELVLLTEWFVWVFFFDDDCLKRFKDTGNIKAARRALDRLGHFTPLNSVTPHTPENGLERGLLDLWERTIGPMSLPWRQRFASDTQDMLQDTIAEMVNTVTGRTPNPIDYLDIRRTSGGSLWVADLIEHERRREISPSIIRTRPVRVLREAFADGVHLLNDLYSYPREINRERERTNSVLVLQHVTGCTPQQAADAVNTVRSARLAQFEQIITEDLPDLADRHHLSSDQRKALFTVAAALRTWQDGITEWHQRSSRYQETS
ncbi:terpene synthase family protein [Streptomyces chartreusis]|uniref:terpene synthase family protein n=1 Tax=Streptomyces chartreusis TaxID=1969 RepID=UPI002E19A499